jgi:hypothetical protein
MSDNRPPREVVAEYLSYNPATGTFRWLKAAGRQPTGAIAGGIEEHNPGKFYREIKLLKRRYPATHIAWLLMTGEWPTVQVDHRNHDTLDNSWTNLRLATPSQNGMNKKGKRTSVSGYKGVHLATHPKWHISKPWVAQIGGKHIGNFATAEEAARAYDAAALEAHGEYAYLNFPRLP